MRALHCLGRHKPVDVDGLVRSWSSIVPTAPAVPVCLGATAGEGSQGEGNVAATGGRFFQCASGRVACDTAVVAPG